MCIKLNVLSYWYFANSFIETYQELGKELSLNNRGRTLVAVYHCHCICGLKTVVFLLAESVSILIAISDHHGILVAIMYIHKN
jgi:hypothetical protein